jgi:hypothetical protein
VEREGWTAGGISSLSVKRFRSMVAATFGLSISALDLGGFNWLQQHGIAQPRNEHRSSSLMPPTRRLLCFDHSSQVLSFSGTFPFPIPFPCPLHRPGSSINTNPTPSANQGAMYFSATLR